MADAPAPADQREVWTAIADAFDRTRQRPWGHVTAFLETLPRGARVLDLMAGNGRHAKAALALGLDAVCLDWSAPLLAHAPGQRVLADAARLPLGDGTVGACVFAAGLHGLPTADGRAACLRELRRVLAPGAPAQVTVWWREAPRFRGTGPAGQPCDVEVPWRSGGAVRQRHYHLYTEAELAADLRAAGFAVEDLEAKPVGGPEPDNLVALVHAKGTLGR